MTPWWQGKSAAKQEIELANKLGKILTDIVSREVGKLVTERRRFYHNLVQNKADAQGIVSALISEIEISLNRNRDLALEVGQLEASKDNRTAQDYQRDISDLKWEHDRKIRECEGQIKELVQEVSRLESVVKGDKQILEIHEKEVQTLKQNNETQRKDAQRVQARHNAEKIRLQEALEAEKGESIAALQRLREEHNAEEGRMQKEHESNQARLRAMMAKMKQEHDSKQKQMRKEANEEEARLKSEFEAKKAQLETAHAAETKRLRRDIEAYSEDLLARDDFKPMPDNDIKARFQDLAQEIDTLARLEWKPNQKEWTDQVLQLLSGNQRLLKKQILQDSVWVILHDNIFCSPFRVFGEEGRPLESQWNDEYGKGWSSRTLLPPLLSPALISADSQLDNGSYIWPEPSIDAERWRYATIKECRAALEKPVSEWDPRARLRKGFRTFLDALKQELMSTLGEVSSLDKSSVQRAESIIKKAAKMWLEFGMQRCRILVIVQGSNLKSAEERIQRAREATLELVVVPELKRFGNSKGQDVHIEETVGDCGGEMVEVSMTR